MDGLDLEIKKKLNAIDTEAEEISEAIGISAREFTDAYFELERQVDSGIEKQPFTEEEIREEYFEQGFGPVSALKILIALWRDLGREEISIKEFILTIILLKKIEKKEAVYLRYIQNMLNSLQVIGRPIVDIDKAKQIVETHGDQISLWESSCRKHFEEFKGSKGCPSELGCKKMNFLIRALTACEKYRPRSWQDFLDTQKWFKAKVEEILSKKTLEELENVFVPL